MIRSIWRFRRLLRSYRLLLGIGTVLVFIDAVTSVAAPWPLKVIVDNVLKGRPLHGHFRSLADIFVRNESRHSLLVAAIAALVVLAVVSAFADYLGTYLLTGVGERMIADLRTEVFAHLQRQSLSYHDRQRIGDLLTRITGDPNYVQDMLVALLSVLLPNAAVLAGIVIVMFFVDPVFALISISVAPLFAVAAFTYTHRIKRASRRARKKEGEVANVASETLSSMRVVQAYTKEPAHFGSFSSRNRERLLAGLEARDLQAKLSPIIDFLTVIGTVVVLWFGVHRVQAGTMTLGVLLVFLAYIAQLYKPMRNLSKLAWTFSRGQASAERLHDILHTTDEVKDLPQAHLAPRLRGEVELRQVTFGYAPGLPVLHDVTLKAFAGETVAIAGPTGAGKSTVLSLIPRLYDVWNGAVLLDNRDVRSYTLNSVRQQVALVLQDSILFHGTIYENIAYGAERPLPEDVLAAAQAAYVDEFVDELPEGYETLVSERGTTLSGGQRQRIAIARALVRNAPIVILDEPTSDLDALTERYVVKALERLMQDRTVFVVAHRLSTLRSADTIYVIEHGRIVDFGPHETLVQRDGLYQQMHDATTEPQREPLAVVDQTETATGR